MRPFYVFAGSCALILAVWEFAILQEWPQAHAGWTLGGMSALVLACGAWVDREFRCLHDWKAKP